MTSSFDRCLAFTLAREGGFVQNPADPGGATNMGITLTTLRAWREDHGDEAPDVNDLLHLSRDEASAIYGAWFWNVVRGDRLLPGVNLAVFDFGVTASPRRSAILLQQAVGATADGSIGPETLGLVGIACCGRGGAGTLIGKLRTAQDGYYRTRPTFATFGKGELARSALRWSAALALAADMAPSSVTPSADDLNAAELAWVTAG